MATAELRHRAPSASPAPPVATPGPPPLPPSDGDEGGAYDCNICYDTAREPVVTLCGHLFCWPCLYR